MDDKKKKIRVAMRKNRAKPPRGNDLTRAFHDDADKAGDAKNTERVRAKGDVSRHRTIVQDDSAAGAAGSPAMAADCVRGRVVRVHGLASVVEADDGRVFRCAVRRLLKTLATDERNVVTTGDIVWVRPVGVGSGDKVDSGEWTVDSEEAGAESRPPAPESPVLLSTPHCPLPTSSPLPTVHSPLSTLSPLSTAHCPLPPTPEGMIERVEPRHGVLTRASRRREHVLVANVDQVAIIVSLVEPDLKPHLIDRYLAAARQGGLKPLLCLNKIDRADAAGLQPLVGAFAQLGVAVLLTSARTGVGIDRLRERLRGRATVFSGQSGVGKSSLLNAVQPGLALAVKPVSEGNQKGRHTTTYAHLIRLATGGWVVDTPGVRQLALWDVRPAEVEGFFGEFRPFVPLCAFPDCTHTHETGCAVKEGVARRQISARRYHSYLGMFSGSIEA